MLHAWGLRAVLGELFSASPCYPPELPSEAVNATSASTHHYCWLVAQHFPSRSLQAHKIALTYMPERDAHTLYLKQAQIMESQGADFFDFVLELC
jgi:hypothetical protein